MQCTMRRITSWNGYAQPMFAFSCFGPPGCCRSLNVLCALETNKTSTLNTMLSIMVESLDNVKQLTKNNNDVRITSWIVKCKHFFLLVFNIFKFVWSLTVNLWFRSWWFLCLGMIFLLPNSDQIIISTCGSKRYSYCQGLKLHYGSLIKIMKIISDIRK